MKHLFIFLIFHVTTAQPLKIKLKDFQLVGNVKSFLETAEKQGVILTEKERNNDNVFYSDIFYPVVASNIFNKNGLIVEKREVPYIDQKTIYLYNDTNQLMSASDYKLALAHKNNKPFTTKSYRYENNDIIETRTTFNDNNTQEQLTITKKYDKNLLVLDTTDQKSVKYTYDILGNLTKTEAWKNKNPTVKKIENHQLIYENNVLVSDFCPERNTTKTYYPNGLLKSYQTDFRLQEHVYTYDEIGNWITSTVTLDGKPSATYYRTYEYFD